MRAAARVKLSRPRNVVVEPLSSHTGIMSPYRGGRMIHRWRLWLALAISGVMSRIAFARAQPSPVTIGWLAWGSRVPHERSFSAFKEAMLSLRWRDGTNYSIEAVE
jgi:hypothetical protein